MRCGGGGGSVRQFPVSGCCTGPQLPGGCDRAWTSRGGGGAGPLREWIPTLWGGGEGVRGGGAGPGNTGTKGHCRGGGPRSGGS